MQAPRRTGQPTGIDELEPAAWDALRDDGCTAVVAGPGAGKTEFLAQRAAFLLQTGLCPAPRRILAISFKRDSAANLARRVAARVPEHAGRFVSLTFDAFTKGLVDRFRSALPQAMGDERPLRDRVLDSSGTRGFRHQPGPERIRETPARPFRAAGQRSS